MFKHIVVGCDGSPEGHDAVALGASIANATDASLSLVAVFSPPLVAIPGVAVLSGFADEHVPRCLDPARRGSG